jgi:hypothetical protein
MYQIRTRHVPDAQEIDIDFNKVFDCEGFEPFLIGSELAHLSLFFSCRYNREELVAI